MKKFYDNWRNYGLGWKRENLQKINGIKKSDHNCHCTKFLCFVVVFLYAEINKDLYDSVLMTIPKIDVYSLKISY